MEQRVYCKSFASLTWGSRSARPTSLWSTHRLQSPLRFLILEAVDRYMMIQIPSELIMSMILLILWAGVCDTPAQGHNRIDRILMPTSCNFFFRSRYRKNSKVKRAWLGAIPRWVTDREFLPGCSRVRTKCAEKTCVGL